MTGSKVAGVANSNLGGIVAASLTPVTLPDLLTGGGAGPIGGLPNFFARSSVPCVDFPDGEGAAALVDQARRRIESVFGHGDLTAMKAALAVYRDDPAWRRTMPPLRPLPDERAAAFVDDIAATGYRYGAAA